jgi:hypothetical protein
VGDTILDSAQPFCKIAHVSMLSSITAVPRMPTVITAFEETMNGKANSGIRQGILRSNKSEQCSPQAGKRSCAQSF